MLFSEKFEETVPVRSASFWLKCRPRGSGGGTSVSARAREPRFLAVHYACPNLGAPSHGPHGAAISVPLFD